MCHSIVGMTLVQLSGTADADNINTLIINHLNTKYDQTFGLIIIPLQVTGLDQTWD